MVENQFFEMAPFFRQECLHSLRGEVDTVGDAETEKCRWQQRQELSVNSSAGFKGQRVQIRQDGYGRGEQLLYSRVCSVGLALFIDVELDEGHIAEALESLITVDFFHP